ncbi:alpha/beta fold hydrolase [Advenella sp. S44]|uniref:alpha/beta fold hydrolase n=1 Tax=Advenella sp. S44 TaxID=1982755 RepID=UPI001F5BEDFE|nr:alpha/beta hydrolase [Advenella sp. S44]
MNNLPLLLLPGTLCDAEVWAPFRSHLPSINTHAVSLSGERSTAEMARSLLQNAPSRFIVMGFSLGGLVALEIMAQAPERILGLALIAANARPDPPENTASRRNGVATAIREGLTVHVTRDLWPSYVAESRLSDHALRRQVCNMAERVGTSVYADQAEIALNRIDSRPRLSNIDVPTLIVSGSEDKLNPKDRQEELASGISDSRWIELQGVGHMIPLEAPAELAEATQCWLKRITAL